MHVQKRIFVTEMSTGSITGILQKNYNLLCCLTQTVDETVLGENHEKIFMASFPTKKMGKI